MQLFPAANILLLQSGKPVDKRLSKLPSNDNQFNWSRLLTDPLMLTIVQKDIEGSLHARAHTG